MQNTSSLAATFHRILLIFATLCFGFSLQAQNLSALEALAKDNRLKMQFSYEILTPSGTSNSGNGTIVYQDKSYRIETSDALICDDGVALWTLNRRFKEVSVQNSPGTDFLSDPDALSSLLTGGSTGKPQITCTLSPDKTTAMITLKASDGATGKLLLSGIELQEKGALADFALDCTTLGKDYVITDLR